MYVSLQQCVGWGEGEGKRKVWQETVGSCSPGDWVKVQGAETEGMWDWRVGGCANAAVPFENWGGLLGYEGKDQMLLERERATHPVWRQKKNRANDYYLLKRKLASVSNFLWSQGRMPNQQFYHPRKKKKCTELHIVWPSTHFSHRKGKKKTTFSCWLQLLGHSTCGLQATDVQCNCRIRGLSGRVN